ncbi:MAG: SBBP repeat-containing protein [Ignavibacteria bacterium]|nr:SBBP repeat-containing protein [Ignavibacteria bacterium]
MWKSLKTSILVAFIVSAGELSAQSLPRVSVEGFVANVGQWPAEVLFASRNNGSDVWSTRTGVVHDSYSISSAEGIRRGTIVREAFNGVNSRFRLSASTPTAKVHFIQGYSGSEWYSAPVYSSVALMEYYPGVMFTFRHEPNGNVIRTIVAGDGADLSQISYEVFGGERPVTANITPSTSTVYGTYLGGASSDAIANIEYLPKGEVVVVGQTSSMTFPNATGGYSTVIKGATDGFVARFDRKLRRVISYTYYGGTGEDRITAVTKDVANNIVVTGETTSTDLPTTSGVTGKQFKAGIDAFVAKFDSTLSKLLVGFYHGGNNDDQPRSIIVDQNNMIYISGGTTSTANFPVTFPLIVKYEIPWTFPKQYLEMPGGGGNVGQVDGFVSVFTATGSIRHSRFYGGDGVESFTSMALDASGNVYLTGSTTSSNFETAPHKNEYFEPKLSPFDATFNGGKTDAFIVKLTSELGLVRTDDGTYSTFYGGNGDDEGKSVFVDGTGKAYVIGNTTSTNIPTTGLVNIQPIGQKDIFYTVFSVSGRELLSGMYFGGSGQDHVACAKQYQGGASAVIVGSTSSSDFPVFGDATVDDRSGATDGFIAILGSSTNKFTTLLPGSGVDTVISVLEDPYGDLYYAATTTSLDLATQDSSYADYAAGRTNYVAKYAFGIVDLTQPSGGATWCIGSSQTVSWSKQGIEDSVRYQIEVSRAGLEDWTTVAHSVKGNGYRWTIPSMPSGSYVLRLTSSRGHVSQLVTPLIIAGPPALTQQPMSSSACEGRPLTLGVAATGQELTYQWRRNGVDIKDAIGPDYTIPALSPQTVGQYVCVVNGKCSPNVTSQAAVVTIAPSTTITTQPVSRVVVQNTTLRLSVQATGGGLTYQWQKNGDPIPGATRSEYSVLAAALSDAGKYRCEVTGGCGTVTSDEIVVDVTPTTGVEEDPASQVRWVQLLGPIPASDVISVALSPSNPVHLSLRITDGQGRVVSSRDIGTITSITQIVQVSTSNLSSGVYALEFVGEQHSVRIPIIVQH